MTNRIARASRSQCRALPGPTDKIQRILDMLQTVNAERLRPREQTPEDEPEFADEIPMPLLPSVDEVFGRLLAKRLIDQNPGLAEALRTRAVAVVIDVPSSDLVPIVHDGLLHVVDSDRPADQSDNATSTWTTFMRDGSGKAHKPDEGNLSLRRTLARGRAVVGISPDATRYLPSDLLRVADYRMSTSPLDAVMLRELAEATTGTASNMIFDDRELRQLTFGDLTLAARSGQDANAYINCVLSLASRGTAHSSVTLDDMHGMDEFVAWGRALAQDLADYREGKLAWRDIDRGVLLHGPTGTGKTTSAKALAASCGVPLVVGSFGRWQEAGYLNDTLKAMHQSFDEARRLAPSILFIDEIDSVGDRRAFSGKNRGYETQFLNAFLEHLDGFDARDGIVVIAATNYAEHLDEAIRRPGRLDRDIHIGIPDQKGLAGVLRFHLGADLPGADLSIAALLGLGKTGAHAERWVRDARRRARQGRRPLTLDDLHAVIRGPVREASPVERYRIAVHEAGHALVATLDAPGSVKQASILSTTEFVGGVLANFGGKAMIDAKGVRALLRYALAGRAAEEVIFGEASSGAGGGDKSDLALATTLAATALSALGMRQGKERLRWSGVPDPDTLPMMLAADRVLAAEVTEMLDVAYAQTMSVIREHRGALDSLVKALLEDVVLNGEQIVRIVGAEKAWRADLNPGADRPRSKRH